MAEEARQLRRGLSGLDASTMAAARESLDGRRKGLRAFLPFAGPAFIASVAYMDPGNFAVNIQGGALYGYRLLWVVVFANAVAMLFQALAAKLGIATGRNLAELSRSRFPRPVALAMWVAAEVAAMATDLAEFLGATLALNLLFGVPLLVAAGATAGATYAILALQRHGFRLIEAAITALIAVVAISYLLETVFSHPAWRAVLAGSTTPWLGTSGALLLAVGVIGATVMPHAIYIHSGLTSERIPPYHPGDRRKILRFSNFDVLIALALAGIVNLAMMAAAAAAFHPGHSQVASIQTAYQTLTPLLGPAAAFVFLSALLASGLSSSAVGTMAGALVMQGFTGWSIPLWLRRGLTMLPTLAVIAIGVNPTQALIISQVVLSLVLPLPVITLILFTSDRKLMHELANSRFTNVLAISAAAVIVGLNVVLLVQTAGLPLPFIG